MTNVNKSIRDLFTKNADPDSCFTSGLVFPDNHVENNPYKIFFGQGDWTCSVAEFTGTHRGPMMGFDGKMVQATGKSFKLDFCTVAHWKDGRIVEENLFYDLVGMMKQLGLM